MRASSASMRLEAHRLKWIRDDRRIPLIPFHELTESERQFFVEELTRDASVRRLNVSEPADEAVFDGMMLDILNEWGIMCPHNAASVEETKHGYHCSTCDCYLVIGPHRKPAKIGV